MAFTILTSSVRDPKAGPAKAREADITGGRRQERNCRLAVQKLVLTSQRGNPGWPGGGTDDLAPQDAPLETSRPSSACRQAPKGARLLRYRGAKKRDVPGRGGNSAVDIIVNRDCE
jgi:hypothetical protein